MKKPCSQWPLDRQSPHSSNWIQQTRFRLQHYPPMLSLMLYILQAFPSVLSPSAKLLLILTIWSFTFSANSAKSDRFFFTSHHWKQYSVLACGTTLVKQWPNFCPSANHICEVENNRYNQILNYANDCIDYSFAMCKFVCIHTGSICIFTAWMTNIWLLRIYGSFFPCSLYSQALFLPKLKSMSHL